jgi:transposase
MSRRKHRLRQRRAERREAARRELPLAELVGIAERAKSSPITEADYATLKAALETLAFLTQELAAKGTTIDRLRRMLFGGSTEKTDQVVPRSEDEASNGNERASGADDERREAKRPGHGRNGAAAYPGAKKVHVPHVDLGAGTVCPDCEKGKVYPLAEPAQLVRVQGMAPLGATIYECDRLRCNLCGEVFTAKAPEGVGDEKYDATAAAMIALLKYGAGLPFHRIEKLQAGLGIPLPATTQWEIVWGASKLVAAANDELIRQAAQSELVHNDDTTARILDLGSAPTEEEPASVEDERTGIFTTAIVAETSGRRIALFFTGTRHAGENLAAVLARRAAGLGAPIQMCDALSRNLPGDLKTILANCISHARRRFVDVVNDFPDECRYLLVTLGEVYQIDALARERSLSPDERLALHQAESGPLMDGLEKWLRALLSEHKVEPNSGLGEAIGYMLKHWMKLTLFLRVAGAPLDNNVCERALKKAILHRKNALFYKTQNGAHVGDTFMSLIHTAELNGENPFDYLVALQQHCDEVVANPGAWMPWTYRETLARRAEARAASE